MPRLKMQLFLAIRKRFKTWLIVEDCLLRRRQQHNKVFGQSTYWITSSTSRMAEWFGKTNKEIRRAIEICKQNGLPRNGPVRNPDVVVDPNGTVYPQLPNGGIGDPIGNLHDYLPK